MSQAEFQGEPAYPERITCFIDILGFTEEVKGLARRLPLLLPVDAVLRHIASCKHDMDRARTEGRNRHDARMTHFSDCLVLSYRPEPGAAGRALWDAAFIGQTILRAGFLLRGAITLGRLCHDDSVMFGQAFLDAYELEQTQVVTPRVVIADDVMRLVRRDFAHDQCSDLELDYIRDDGDRPYVHILGKEWSFLEKERAQEAAMEFQGSGVLMMFEELQGMLRIRYQEAREDKHRIKLEWMKNYVNRAADEHGLPRDLKVTFSPR